MRKITLHLIIYIAALLCFSCTPKQKAESAVKDFLSNNLTKKDFSVISYGRLDSTRYITDGIVKELRLQASKDKAFTITQEYAERDNPKQLIFLPVKIKQDNQEQDYTFYLTMDFEKVVCFK